MSDFDPAFLEDRYRTVLISKLKEKRAELPKKAVPTTPSAQNVISLMDVLKRSLAAEQPVARTSPTKPAPRRVAAPSRGAPKRSSRARSKNGLTSRSDAQSLNVSSNLPSPHEGICSDMLDCLVIGGGPAGLLAAVYLGRYRRSVQVIDAGESRAAKIPESHNYPGFFGIAGPELLRRLNAQARQYGAELVSGRVTSLRKEGDTFVASSSGSDVNARFILLATGLVDQCPTIEGQPADCPSEVIRFCPICDGYEAIDRRVGVVGDIKAGGKKALFLRTYTKDVSLFLTDETEDVDWQEKLAKANVRIVGNLKQVRQTTENTITVVTQQGDTHEVDALYPALGCIVRSDLATGLGASSTENGNLEVDDHQRTTIGGLYAAGDVVTDLHQLSVAFGHAAIAATDIHNRLPPNPR